MDNKIKAQILDRLWFLWLDREYSSLNLFEFMGSLNALGLVKGHNLFKKTNEETLEWLTETLRK